MIRHIQRYFAIASYVKRLSGELTRRFGKRPFYKVEHVTQAVQRSGLSQAFIAYAHAAFCREEDFDARYEPLGVACTYLGLRQTIGNRYFSKRLDFDAHTIFNRFRRAKNFTCGSSDGNCEGANGTDSAGDSY